MRQGIVSSLATKKISTIAKVLSISISRIIGTASKNIASPIGPVVKSRLDPRTASRSIAQNELSTASAGRGEFLLNDIGLHCKIKGYRTCVYTDLSRNKDAQKVRTNFNGELADGGLHNFSNIAQRYADVKS